MIPLGILASSALRASAVLLAPTDLVATMVGGLVKLAWTDLNTIETGHRIYRSSSPMDTADMPPSVAELGPDVIGWEDSDTPVDQVVYYIVSAVRGAEEAFSDEVLIDTTPQVPLPTVIGEEFGGGYYIGDITIADGGEDDGVYAVIMGGPESQAYLAWKNPRSLTPGTESNTNSMANTLAMQANDPVTHYAGMHCLGYDGGGFDDWCMPARHVLSLAWNNRASLGALAMGAQYYWSSTQSTGTIAWYQSFSSGTETTSSKTNSERVRPVRQLKRP